MDVLDPAHDALDDDSWGTASEGDSELEGDDEHSADAASRGVGQHGCQHYRRRCKLIAPCCGEEFWCRHCHNAAKDDSEQDPTKRHQMDRKLVQEVVCALCHERQPTALACAHCGVSFGRYSCSKCNFYDDDTSKEQFHCDACGICRVGGQDNFFHCETCNCCYATSLQQQHVCVQNSMHQNCPVCFEYLFDSVRPISVLPCGHTIHQECYQSLLSHDSICCPICLKSCVSAAHRERMWSGLDAAIRAAPMPEEYRAQRVDILCNDCSRRSTAPFHVIGHKCGPCGSYNTRRV